MSLKKLWLLAGVGSLLIAVCTAGWWSRSQAQAQPGGADSTPEAWKGLTYESAETCTTCHAFPQPKYQRAKGQNRAMDIALMTEYSIYKTHDKHAQAYAALKGQRGKDILGRMGLKDAALKDTGCLNCHSMSNLNVKDEKGNLDPEDGVSCGGCHGPSSKWNPEHQKATWRDQTAKEKFALGMRDLRDPVQRSQVCLSCHVGNVPEGKVVTHAMMAAGHPALPPIEIATFSDNEPRHWRHVRDVPYFEENRANQKMLQERYGFRDAGDVKFQRTRMAVVGAVLALRETMKLAHDRVPDAMNHDSVTIWPELRNKAIEGDARDRWSEVALPHSDCFACHHDLRYPGFRQKRGLGYHLPGNDLVPVRPGRVVVREWPLALQDSALQTAEKGVEIGNLRACLKDLATASTTKPFGEPTEVRGAAEKTIAWCNAAVTTLADVHWDADKVLRLMHRLCAIAEQPKDKTPYLPDQESARQIGSLLRVAFDDWSKATGQNPVGVAALIKDLAKEVDAEPYIKRSDRLAITLDIVTKGKNPGALDAVKKYLEDPASDAQVEASTNMDSDLGKFLLAVFAGISNAEFNKGILAADAKLQPLSDAEQRHLLETIANFDPEKFLAGLRKIGKKLPESKR